MQALRLLSETEGIIPAIESAHALAGALRIGRELGPDAILAVCLSGRGDKDMDTAARYFDLYDASRGDVPPAVDAARGRARALTSRVAAAIDAARAEGRGAFVGYLPIGFPDLQTSIDAAVALAESGADILELGPPYSDPVMDGAIIQEATQTALAGGFRLRDTFTAVREITRRVDVPVLVMTYWNPVLQYGVDRYADDLLAAGGAGLITPDITPDAAEEWITREPPHRPRPRVPRRPDLDRRATRPHRARLDRIRLHRLDDGHHGGADPAGCRRPHPRRAPARARRRARAASASASPTPSRSRVSSTTPTARSSAPPWCGRCATAESTASPSPTRTLAAGTRVPARLLRSARRRHPDQQGHDRP